MLDREETCEEERNTGFSLSTSKEIFRGLKKILESKIGTPSSERIVQYVDMALQALEIIYRANGYAVEGFSDRNGHRRKLLGEGKSISWVDARTKVKGRECEFIKNMFLHSDMLKLCLKKNKTSLSFSLTQLFLQS